MASLKLLVNADDLGLSPAINAGILASHLDGIVTSSSIVAAGAAFTEALDLSRRHSTLAIGIHLTLIEENAAAPPAKIPTLAPHGVLPPSYESLIKWLLTGRIRLPDIERELRAQIEKCLAAGIEPTHLDSHQHTHAFPPLFRLAVRLAKDYAIPGIRIPRAWPAFTDLSSNRFWGKCALSLLAQADVMLFPPTNCVTTQRFTGLYESGDLTEEKLLNILAGLTPGTTELVCHPSFPDDMSRYANWVGKRQLELATLTSPRIRQTVQQLGIELINYRQL